jgi:acyl-CoA thioester hydrolase
MIAARSAPLLTPLVKVAQLRVLYHDTDQMGVVNNVHYLRWFEVGRAEWIRSAGISYRDIETMGVKLPLVEANLRYKEPARYDDLIDVETALAEVRTASVKFVYLLRRSEGGAALCEGFTMHACVGEDGRVARLPPRLVRVLKGEKQ